MSGRNDLLIYPYTRALGMAPANAIYVEITDGATTYNLLLGDGSAPDFNFTGGYAYNIKAAINGTDTYDLRVGNTLPAGTAITDLNAIAGGETANCYIAGANKWYMFNSTVMGNGATTSAHGAANAADIIPSKLNPASADVLWETLNTDTKPTPAGVVVNNNLYLLKDRILFKSGNTEGNAVIAARDATNQIIWSWHIWRINDTPSAILLKDITSTDKGFVASGIKMMDRNLGALEVPTTAGTVLSMGFLYQWGRKDPFINASTNDETNNQPWALATNVDFKTDQSTAPASSVAMSIASPTTFYIGTSGSSYSWCTVRNDNYWGTPSTGNTVTIGSKTYDSNRGSKTIYDPCPAGWRVPSQYVYANAIGQAGSYNKGLELNTFFTASGSIFLPAAGYRGNSSGRALYQGSDGNYWSSSVPSDNSYAGYMYFFTSSPDTNAGYCAHGYSVRCVQEQ